MKKGKVNKQKIKNKLLIFLLIKYNQIIDYKFIFTILIKG